MKILPAREPNFHLTDIDRYPGVVSCRKRSYTWKAGIGEPSFLLCERPSRYHREKPLKIHPFRKDLLWKTIIEDFRDEFLQFFFPSIAAGRDPEQKIEFLDNELLQLFPGKNDQFTPRRPDKLLKISMRDGSAVILHCEVQGYRQADFSPRMFRYFFRLWDNYPQKVSAIAILTDGDRGFRPGPYIELAGPERIHRLCYRYEIYKVLDQSEEELERRNNPIALVVLTTKAALKRKNGEYTEQEYFRRKLKLAHWLKGSALSETQMQALLSFLKYYLPLENETLEHRFNEQLKEGSNIMGTVEYLIDEAKEEAKENEKLFFVRSLLADTDFNDEKIASLAAAGLDLVRKERKTAVIRGGAIGQASAASD